MSSFGRLQRNLNKPKSDSVPIPVPNLSHTAIKTFDPNNALPEALKPVPAKSSDHHSEKALTNPAYIGPGVWYIIHFTAKKAGETGYTSKKQFMDLMSDLRANFPCETCRKHIGQYLDSHPFDSYFTRIQPGTQKDIGLFLWSVEFHNTVNKRLGKQVLTEAQAIDLFYNENNSCSLDCGH